MAFEMIAELMAWALQSRVSVFLAFDRPWFAPARPLRNQIAGQGPEQFCPQILALGFGSSLSHGLRELAKGIHAAFEADPVQRHGVLGGGLRHCAAHEVVSN